MTEEEAIDRLRENGTLRLSNDDGIDCREELEGEDRKLRNHLDEFGVDYEIDR